MEAPAPVALQAVQRDASGQPVVVENEVIRLRVPGVELFIGGASSSGKGVLFITTRYARPFLRFANTDRNVVWLNDADANKSLSVGFRSIVIHAIAKDTATFPHPCIYCQLDGGDNEEDEIRELRFVPTPDVSLEGIYALMNECAALNPDSDADDDDDEDGDNFFWNGGPSNPTAAAQLAHLESVFQAPAENGATGDDEDVEEAEDMES